MTVKTVARQADHPKGARRRIRLLMIAFVIFMCWACATLWGQIESMSSKSAQLSVLTNRMNDLKATNEGYKRDQIMLNDKEYIEQVDRKDYQMSRPGDTPLIAPSSKR